MMAFFGLFKKKDEFDSMLKDPLTEPFGKMPDMPASPMQGDPFAQQSVQQQPQDLPPFDMNAGLPKSDMASGYSSPMSTGNYNTSASSFPQAQNNSYDSYPQRRNKGPETYEDMVAQGQVPYAKPPESSSSFDKKDFEIINLKLDTIKSQLESLSSRLANLEKKPEEELPRSRRYNW